jgi:hypothetical protein
VDLTEPSLFGDRPILPTGPLSERFVVPPFSVLDARLTEWMRRKAAWLALAVHEEGGRDVSPMGTAEDASDAVGEAINALPRASLFDPVLAEVVYTWFSKPGAEIYDPFCGGAVRGMVAAHMDRDYWGLDIRPEQVEANRAHLKWSLLGSPFSAPPLHKSRPRPSWYVGDGTHSWARDGSYDLLFTCPPYGPLERYSDDPRDLSTMSPDAFHAAFSVGMCNAAATLKDNRFAVVVIGDVRTPDGEYWDLPGMVLGAATLAELRLWNHLILLTPMGTARMRAGRSFEVSRKVALVHQHVLVFVKGDAKKAVAWLGT